MDDTEKTVEAAETKRKEDLAADLARKDEVEVDLYARQQGVDVSDCKSVEDKRAKIELAAEATARKTIDDGRVQRMEAAQATAIRKQDDNRDDTARTMRALNALFCRDIPQDARSNAWKPEKNHATFGGDYDVKNGVYRVVGSEWLFEIRNKKLVNAERASEQNRFGGKSVISVE